MTSASGSRASNAYDYINRLAFKASMGCHYDRTPLRWYAVWLYLGPVNELRRQGEPLKCCALKIDRWLHFFAQILSVSLVCLHEWASTWAALCLLGRYSLPALPPSCSFHSRPHSFSAALFSHSLSSSPVPVDRLLGYIDDDPMPNAHLRTAL